MSSVPTSLPAREPAPAYRSEGDHALWHVSEDPSLGVLEPRRPRTATSDHRLVWSVDTAARSSQRYSAPIGALSQTLDATFFALSDAKRRGILERLGRGPATLSQLASPSGLTLNGIKKHVGVLELAGLVETEKVGRARECRLSPAATLGEAGEWIEAHRRAWEGRLDRFERFVEDAG
jgi:DNA-binding transcriptional ArsR family regulator